MGSETDRARSRSRTLRKRGDLAGARAVLEAALAETQDELSRAALTADLSELKSDTESLVTREERAAPEGDGLIGRSPAMVRLRQEVAKAAAPSAPLLI